MRTESSRAFPGRGRPPVRSRRIARGAVAVAAALTAAAALAAAPKAPPGWKPGWLAAPASYLGRYDLTAASAAGAAEKGARGELTLFIQVAFPGKPGVPSGIISLRDARNDEVAYLTDLDHDGTQRLALVHGGAFVAPPIGTFTVTTAAGGVVGGTLEARGLGTLRLTFKRFSTNPAP
jgi:hypothetical protein